jgi:hypothetical protein
MILKSTPGTEEIQFDTANGEFTHNGKVVPVLGPQSFVIRGDDGSERFAPDYLAYAKWVKFCLKMKELKDRPKIKV